jgi:multiple sugar transport system permease protein
MNKLKNKTSGILVYSDYKKKSYRILYWVMFSILLIISLIFVFPIIWLFFSSFKTPIELYQVPFSLLPEKFNFAKITNVWTSLQLGRYFLNSLIVVIGATIVSIVFNGILAYTISIRKPVGYKIILGLIMGSLMIPAILSMGPLFNNIVKLGLINSYLPLMLVFGANPFYFVLFKTYFDTLPISLIEAAKLDGCNDFQVFTKVVIPLSRPIVSVVAIFTINAAWCDFLLPYLVLRDDVKQTIMVKIFLLQSNMGTSMQFGPDTLLMLLMLSIIPPIILFFIFQKQIMNITMSAGLKE